MRNDEFSPEIEGLFLEKDSFKYRLNRIKWSAYETAYGPAVDVPGLLSGLTSANHDKAITASSDLWSGLVHQEVQLHTAALPALAFILETVVEILYYMAKGTKPDFWKMGDVPSWALQLRQALQAELPRFLKMKESGANEDIRDCASCIVDALSPG